MPSEVVRRHLNQASDQLTLDDIAELAATLGVGVRALLHHLGNLDEIRPETRDRLQAELDAGSWG